MIIMKAIIMIIKFQKKKYSNFLKEFNKKEERI